jgi:cathepsin F
LTPYQHFNNFVVAHRKQYASAEERKYRFQIFLDNLNEIDRLNALNNGATYGITRFADMTTEEFIHTFIHKPFMPKRGTYTNATKALGEDLPESFDWRDHGAVTPVKNQGGCGSCWAFSSAQNAEGVWAVAGNSLQQFSIQQMLDCTKTCSGCDGGLPERAARKMIRDGGLELEADYPYEEVQGTCRFEKKRIAAVFSSDVDITPDDDSVMEYMYKYGPTTMLIYADAKWQLYTGGVLTQKTCDNVNHAVLNVGWGVDNGQQYWIVKNSWDTTWGEEGYIRLARGDGCCSQYCTSLVA